MTTRKQRKGIVIDPVATTAVITPEPLPAQPSGNGHPENGSNGKPKEPVTAPATEPTPVICPWMEIEQPAERSLKVYALDPSAGQYVGNCMTAKVKWEELEPGPIGRKIAVIDYDAANNLYYPPVDLNDPRILARGGLDPTESDPRFHQQMVYAVASETIDRFEAALGRKIHWRRADRPPTGDGPREKLWHKTQDIWRLNLFPHAMIQANAFYSPEAKGILFGYFTAAKKNQGNNQPGQRVFTCLSHDIIAHEVTHAIIDGIRTYFTEPTNPDVLAFHEAFADLAALFAHFSHKEALIDVIHRTGGLLYRSVIRPDVTPDGKPMIAAEMSTRNSFIDLAQQFGQASGMSRGLRSALGVEPSPDAINTRVNDVHFRGSILVAAVFDAYFTIYIKRTAALMRVFRAGGGSTDNELPAALDEMLADQAASIASEFFTLCVRALDYCPPVDLTFGDFLRALITVHLEQTEDEGRELREALMQAFKSRGIYAADSAFFSQDSLCWQREKWNGLPEDLHKNTATALPPLIPKPIVDTATGKTKLLRPVFGSTSGMTREEKDINGAYFRQYALDNAARLGFDDDPALPPERRPYAPSFHSMFRMMRNGALKTHMVVELVQSTQLPFDPKMPNAGSFPYRAGVTLIIAAPDAGSGGKLREAEVRYAIRKTMKSDRADRQRDYHLATGMADGDVDEPNHFQANFGLLHQGF